MKASRRAASSRRATPLHSSPTGGFHDHRSQVIGTRPGRPRLAQEPAQLLVRRLPRPSSHGLRQPARHQRGPHHPGQRLRHARPSRHGDRQLRPLGRARASRQHRHRRAGQRDRRDPSRRRAADERGPRRPAQRVQPRAERDDPLPADLDRAERARHRAELRAEALRRRLQARRAAPGRFARRPRRLGDDPRRRVDLGRPRRRRGSDRARARPEAQDLRPRRPRQRRRQRRAPRRRRRRRADRREPARDRPTASRPKCWSSTSPA